MEALKREMPALIQARATIGFTPSTVKRFKVFTVSNIADKEFEVKQPRR
jgi:hypothetical protein